MFGEKTPVNTDVCRSRFMQSVRDGNVAELQKRVDIGIEVNFVDQPSLRTPLLEAIARGDAAAVRLLLQANADITARDRQLNTALHLSVAQPDVELTEVVVRAGCPLEECDCRGDTALLKASRHAAAHPHVATLLQRGCRPDAVTHDTGRTPLHCAVAESCDVAVALALLEAKADADVVDSRDGSLPLHLAASLGRIDLVECLVHTGGGGGGDQGGSDAAHDGGGDHGSSSSRNSSSTTSGSGSSATARRGRVTLRPRSHLQRQNRWGCTPHDLAFMDEHCGVAAFLRECTGGRVETQHVLDRNTRLEREAAQRKALEDNISDLVDGFRRRRQAHRESSAGTGSAGAAGAGAAGAGAAGAAGGAGTSARGGGGADGGAGQLPTDRQMRRAVGAAVLAAVGTGLVDEFTNAAVQRARAFLRELVAVDTRLVVNRGIDLLLRVVDVDSQRPFPFLVTVNGGDLPQKWVRVDSALCTVDDTDGNTGVAYRLVMEPFSVQVKEAPFYSSPRFEDPHDKMPPARRGDVVVAHAFEGQWVMTLDHVWQPLVDEYGAVVLERAAAAAAAEEESKTK